MQELAISQLSGASVFTYFKYNKDFCCCCVGLFFFLFRLPVPQKEE